MALLRYGSVRGTDVSVRFIGNANWERFRERSLSELPLSNCIQKFFRPPTCFKIRQLKSALADDNGDCQRAKEPRDEVCRSL
jgi:hypothetical protein